ncbi:MULTISPECIES: hypothetical protein [unclassified Bradyrhizobium]|uniref:hypothetical protein n=1 Tax=unclassified Bradyrhizobium TaxID=2631580 RepID=UPI0028ED98E7|nr:MULTISPECIES: hypothetical protein [unclassified Bradyrhizobium]
MADLSSVRAETEHARKVVARLRRDIAALQANRSTALTEADLQLVLNRVDVLIGERTGCRPWRRERSGLAS